MVPTVQEDTTADRQEDRPSDAALARARDGRVYQLRANSLRNQ